MTLTRKIVVGIAVQLLFDFYWRLQGIQSFSFVFEDSSISSLRCYHLYTPAWDSQQQTDILHVVDFLVVKTGEGSR